MISDKELLRIYMLGFNYELSYPKPTDKLDFDNKISRRAYGIGRDDAIIGDDISSNDEQSNEDILEKIKNIPK